MAEEEKAKEEKGKKAQFDTYREALVVETATVWPADLATVDPARRERIQRQLHAQPDKAAGLEYVRLHSGFCRQITVTADDLQRIQ
jgi:hypothetical protein